MIDKLMECFVHPVKSRILLEIFGKEGVTAGQLGEALGDIPQATIYRQLARMTQDGILKVVTERKVRAVVERVYAVAIDLDLGYGEMIKQNRGDAYFQLFMQYAMQFATLFREYAQRPDIDIANDGSGFSAGPTFATDEELRDVLEGIGALLATLRDNDRPHDPNRRPRTIGVIISPPSARE